MSDPRRPSKPKRKPQPRAGRSRPYCPADIENLTSADYAENPDWLVGAD